MRWRAGKKIGCKCPYSPNEQEHEHLRFRLRQQAKIRGRVKYPHWEPPRYFLRARDKAKEIGEVFKNSQNRYGSKHAKCSELMQIFQRDHDSTWSVGVQQFPCPIIYLYRHYAGPSPAFPTHDEVVPPFTAS